MFTIHFKLHARLIGRISKASLYPPIACLVVAVLATTLEYLGAIDLMPEVGKDNPGMRLTDLSYCDASKVTS
jgi:hypothetical protein